MQTNQSPNHQNIDERDGVVGDMDDHGIEIEELIDRKDVIERIPVRNGFEDHSEEAVTSSAIDTDKETADAAVSRFYDRCSSKGQSMKRPRHPHIQSSDTLFDALISPDNAHLIGNAMAVGHDKKRQIIIARKHNPDLSFGDLAKIYGVSKSTVSRLMRPHVLMAFFDSNDPELAGTAVEELFPNSPSESKKQKSKSTNDFVDKTSSYCAAIMETMPVMPDLHRGNLTQEETSPLEHITTSASPDSLPRSTSKSNLPVVSSNPESRTINSGPVVKKRKHNRRHQNRDNRDEIAPHFVESNRQFSNSYQSALHTSPVHRNEIGQNSFATEDYANHYSDHASGSSILAEASPATPSHEQEADQSNSSVTKHEAMNALQTLWKYAFEREPRLVNSVMQLQKDFVTFSV